MEIKTITTTAFKSLLTTAAHPVLADFFATWCAPCKSLAPVLEQIAKEVPELEICKLDIDQEPHLAEEYHVMGVPTLILFRNGEACGRMTGLHTKKEILEMIHSEEAKKE